MNFQLTQSEFCQLTPEIVQMVGNIHEHKGKQKLFLEANTDELKTLLKVALIQSTGASNRIEGMRSIIYRTSSTEYCYAFSDVRRMVAI